MNATRAHLTDLDWIVAALAERRAPLVELAPVFWHPAPDAALHHRANVTVRTSPDGSDSRTPSRGGLLELDGSGGGEPGLEVALPGAEAITVGAPPVYAPPGPILFLPAPTDATKALPAAISRAPALGCAAIVVNQGADDTDLGAALAAAGFRRHCDYFEGRVAGSSTSR